MTESQQIGHKLIYNVKHVIFETEKSIYFLTYPLLTWNDDTRVPSLYQCVETSSIEVS
jgi:hypothetical protein